MNGRTLAAVAAVLGFAPGAAAAQGYTLRLDGGIQGVSFRGYSADSIPVDSVVLGPNGGLETPTGYAVSCTSNAPYCDFWIPGPIRTTSPAVAQAALSMWGLGLPGLRVQVNAYATTDFNDVSS